MSGHVSWEKDVVCVEGRYVAADLYGQYIIQDDDGDLWIVQPVKDVHFTGEDDS